VILLGKLIADKLLSVLPWSEFLNMPQGRAGWVGGS